MRNVFSRVFASIDPNEELVRGGNFQDGPRALHGGA